VCGFYIELVLGFGPSCDQSDRYLSMLVVLERSVEYKTVHQLWDHVSSRCCMDVGPCDLAHHLDQEDDKAVLYPEGI